MYQHIAILVLILHRICHHALNAIFVMAQQRAVIIHPIFESISFAIAGIYRMCCFSVTPLSLVAP